MAKKSSGWGNLLGRKFNWQESYPSLILAAVIVVVLGLLVANYFNRDGTQEKIDTADEIQNQIAGEVREHKVVKGESLSKISQQYYGSFDFWPQLASVNKIANPNVIHAELVLKIPPKEELEAAKVQAEVTSYKVEVGDTLFEIAEKVYGDGFKWTQIEKANKTGRLPNGNSLIYAGSMLVIPR